MASTWGNSWGTSWGVSWDRSGVTPPVVIPDLIHGGGLDIESLERSRAARERKVKHDRDDLTRIVRNAFRKVTGEPEPAEPVTAKVERKIAKAAIKEIRIEGLTEVQASMAAVRALIREYEAEILASRGRANEIELLLLMAAV